MGILIANRGNLSLIGFEKLDKHLRLPQSLRVTASLHGHLMKIAEMTDRKITTALRLSASQGAPIVYQNLVSMLGIDVNKREHEMKVSLREMLSDDTRRLLETQADRRGTSAEIVASEYLVKMIREVEVDFERLLARAEPDKSEQEMA